MNYSTVLAIRQLEDALSKLLVPQSLRAAISELVRTSVGLGPYASQEVIVHAASERKSDPAAALPGRSHREIASSFYKAAADRETYLGPGLIHDPAWMMILDMFIASEDGRPNTVGSLCTASLVPSTTALRYVDLLERRGLLTRQPNKADARKVWLEPTERSIRAVSQIIDQVESAAARPVKSRAEDQSDLLPRHQAD